MSFLNQSYTVNKVKEKQYKTNAIQLLFLPREWKKFKCLKGTTLENIADGVE